MIRLWILCWVIASMTDPGPAVTVYDCQNSNSTFMALDLIQPQECPDPIKDFGPPFHIQVQIVQSDMVIPWKAYRCRATVTKTITRCGYDSLTYGVQTPVWNRPVQFTPADCRKAVKEGSLTVEGRTYEISINEQRTEHYFSHGHLDKDGNCRYATFLTDGVVYRYSYETVTVVMTIDTIRGKVDRADNGIMFNNGLWAQFSDRVHIDAIHGTFVWNTTMPGCQDTTSTMYTGEVEVRRRRGRSPTDFTEAVVLLENEKTQQFAGVILKKRHPVCNSSTCWTTQIKGLYLCHQVATKLPLPASKFRPGFDTALMQAKTELSFIYIHQSLHTEDRFALIQQEACQLDRRILQVRLHAIAGANNPYSLLDIYGPGHAIYKSGASAYILRCAPIEAALASYGNCTEEIPVTINGTTKFADPFTYVLRDLPTLTVCNDLMPTRHLIAGQWYCVYPETRRCEAPLQLNITMTPYEPHDFLQGLGGGIFSDDQLDRNRKFQIMHETEVPISRKGTINSVDSQEGYGDWGLPFDAAQVGGLASSIGEYISPMIGIFGRMWYYMSGLLFGWVVLETLLGCIWRIIVVIRQRGFGIWVVFALWNTAFTILHSAVDVVHQAMDHIRHQRIPGIDPPQQPPAGDAPAGGNDGDNDLPTYRQMHERLMELAAEQHVLVRHHHALVKDRHDALKFQQDQFLRLDNALPQDHDETPPPLYNEDRMRRRSHTYGTLPKRHPISRPATAPPQAPGEGMLYRDIRQYRHSQVDLDRQSLHDYLMIQQRAREAQQQQQPQQQQHQRNFREDPPDDEVALNAYDQYHQRPSTSSPQPGVEESQL